MNLVNLVTKLVFVTCDVMQCRIELERTRLLVLEAADQLDHLGNKKAQGTIAMAKVTDVPSNLFIV